MGMILIGMVFCLIGGALIETPVIGYLHGENGVVHIVAGIVFGLLFLGPGAAAIIYSVKQMIAERWKLPLKEVLDALNPGFREAGDKNPLSSRLSRFRKHYSEFLDKQTTEENEPIQKDVTQIYRNIMQFQKNRLNRLGLTCEILLRRMAYTKSDGITTKSYSDGKYDILDITEEVAARTIYKKDGKPIYTKVDKELANYTIVRAKTINGKTVICPNCGVETTREALLDGCDYCGTKFAVEDLDSRIAVFAFRPDEKLRYEKYMRLRNRVIFLAVCAVVLGVFLGFTVFAVINGPSLLEEADGGIILTVLASIFAIVIASPVYMLSFLIVYGNIILPTLLLLGGISWLVYRWMQKKAGRPMLNRQFEHRIRERDPNFSIAYFYSSVQNKLSSVIYAETPQQIQAFAYARSDLRGMLEKYRDVVGIDVDQMCITGYDVDQHFQYAGVDARLILTRYNGRRCRVRRETIHVDLVKDAACKTQAVCAPVVMRCAGCGASLDLLQGKGCAYCGRELDLSKYDWVIQGIRL